MKANILMLNTFQQFNFHVSDNNMNLVSFFNKNDDTVHKIRTLESELKTLLNKEGQPKGSGFLSFFGDRFTKDELLAQFKDKNQKMIESLIDSSSLESLSATLHAVAQEMPVSSKNGVSTFYGFVGHFYMFKLAYQDNFISNKDDFNLCDGDEFISYMFFLDRSIKYYHGLKSYSAKDQISNGIKKERDLLKSKHYLMFMIVDSLVRNFYKIFNQLTDLIKQEITSQFDKFEPVLSRPYRTLLELDIFNEYLKKGYFIDFAANDLSLPMYFEFLIGKTSQEPLTSNEASVIHDFFIEDIKSALKKSNVTPAINIDEDEPVSGLDNDGNLLITITPFNISGADSDQINLETA
jgi:hypothetical protein